MKPLDILNAYLQDDKGILTEEQKQTYIDIATKVVLLALPVYKVEEIAVDEGTGIAPLPSEWNSEISFIDSIFDAEGENYEWKIIQTTEGSFISLDISQVSPPVYCRYSYKPAILGEMHNYLIGVYASYLALQQVANYYIQTIDPTITADSVNYRNKAEICERRAEAVLQVYEKVLSQVREYL